MFSHTPPAAELTLVGPKSKVSGNFYRESGNPALKFTNVATDLSERVLGVRKWRGERERQIDRERQTDAAIFSS